jgi:hypothetical protein
LVKIVGPKVTSGQNSFQTLGSGANKCVSCHGNVGQGVSSSKPPICSYVQNKCSQDSVWSYSDLLDEDVNGGVVRMTKQYAPSCAGECNENIALFLKSLGWKRTR